jgi:alanine-glyoxylate transaminase/serine-glyoxylate transaminase/serine-pyruvate transaminase
MLNRKLTMIPGPTPVHDRILDALAQPTTSHVAPSFIESFRACLANLQAIALTETAQPFVVAGAGTLAMEMALVNLIGPDQKLLIVSQGFFGDRWAQLAQAFGLPFESLQAEWGQVVTPDQLESQLKTERYAAVAMTHVDTSTGAAAPVEAYAQLLRGRDELVILDGVCATAGIEQRMDDWGIDLLLTGAQKAFGAPPGLAILLASQRALATRKARGSVPAYYADLLRWLPIMENPAGYFSTPAVNQILALHEATRIVVEEGLEARFRRHRRLARAVRAGLHALGIEPFTDSSCLADTRAGVRDPRGVDDAAFRAMLSQNGVVVAGALGPIAGQAMRIGHMGNIGAGEVSDLLTAIEQTLVALGQEVSPGSAVAAAARFLAARE